MFLETICTPSKYQTEELKSDLELKDIPYMFGEQIFGFSGHKFESSYYDGSASDLSVVSIPSPDALKMFYQWQIFLISKLSRLQKYTKKFLGSHGEILTQFV